MRKGKKVILGLGGIFVTAAVIFTAVNSHGKASLEGIAKQYGIPTSAAELMAINRVPPKENAYPLYLVFRDANKAEDDAVANQSVTMPSFGTLMDPGAEPFSPAKARDYLDLYSRSLSAAEAIANRSKWYVDRDLRDPTATLYPELAYLKGAVKLLVLDAQLKISNRDWTGAIKQYTMAAKIGTFTNSEPVLFCPLVFTSSEAIVINSIAHEAPRVAGNIADARKVISILDAIQKPDLALAMRGQGYFDYYQVKKGLPLNYLWLTDRAHSDDSGAERAVALLNFTRGIWGPDLIAREGQIVQSAQRNDYARFVAQSIRFDNWMDTKGTTQWAASVILPNLTDVGQACERLLAERDLARIGLTAIAEKRLPIVSGTTDPFSGKPYKVVAQPRGWRVYSVGEDGVNGGGAIDTKQPSTSKDIIFSYDGKAAFLVGR